MSVLALLLLGASPIPDLDAALATYRLVVEDARRTGDAELVPVAADSVCRVAYRFTREYNDPAAADAIIAYDGPNADRLKLTCSVFFRARAR
jgi:hypothetical protein